MDESVSGVFDACRDWKVPVTIADPSLNDCPLIYANAAFENLSGYAADEIIGRNCRFLQGSKTDRVEIERIRASIKNSNGITALITNYKKDGEPFKNLLFIEKIALRGGFEVFIGCQYAFSGKITLSGMNKSAESFFEKLTEIEDLWDKTHFMQFNNFAHRTKATMQLVHAHMRRREIMMSAHRS